jgi:peptide/nickel transport system ATP-binding protein
MTAMLKATDLGVRFKGRRKFFGGGGDDVWALKGFSLSLESSSQEEGSEGSGGGTLSIVGESGSGKTTLLRSLLGLILPTTGDIKFHDRSLNAMTAQERQAMRRRCGYVPQDPYGSLPPTLTVLGAVLEPWTLVHGRDEEGLRRAKDLLIEMKLSEELWNMRVRYALSGGQRQRVAVARALILEPELLLADEPTAMQDVSTRGEVLEVLSRRICGGMSMILVTHDLLLARHAAARALVLWKGEIVESGSTADLLERPTHSYTRSLLAALPRL